MVLMNPGWDLYSPAPNESCLYYMNVDYISTIFHVRLNVLFRLRTTNIGRSKKGSPVCRGLLFSLTFYQCVVLASMIRLDHLDYFIHGCNGLQFVL